MNKKQPEYSILKSNEFLGFWKTKHCVDYCPNMIFQLFDNNPLFFQGLLKCSVNPTDPLRAHDVDCGPVLMCSLTVKPELCCYDKRCKPCLWINIQLSFIPDAEFEEDGEGSGYDHDNRGLS